MIWAQTFRVIHWIICRRRVLDHWLSKYGSLEWIIFTISALIKKNVIWEVNHRWFYMAAAIHIFTLFLLFKICHSGIYYIVGNRSLVCSVLYHPTILTSKFQLWVRIIRVCLILLAHLLWRHKQPRRDLFIAWWLRLKFVMNIWWHVLCELQILHYHLIGVVQLRVNFLFWVRPRNIILWKIDLLMLRQPLFWRTIIPQFCAPLRIVSKLRLCINIHFFN